jgi:hypothetical protein
LEQKDNIVSHQGSVVTLQGVLPGPLQATPISVTQLYKYTKGNDTWAFVLVDSISDKTDPPTTNPEIQHILDDFAVVFNDPQTLPPSRSYDHSTTLVPRAVPINSRPYQYSPLHKTKIETQIHKLL